MSRILPAGSVNVNLFLLILLCLTDGPNLISKYMTTAVYLISDVHLILRDNKTERTRRQRLFRFFDMIRETGGALFIVGDLFDFWFEYRRVIPKGYFDVISQLYLLRNSGVDIHFILGNHDYWTGDFFGKYLGIHVYKEAADVEIAGCRVHLTHGDGLLPSDRGYRLMRRLLRSRLTIFLYRWFHPDLGIALAQSTSRLSRKYNPDVGQEDDKFNGLMGYVKERWAAGSDIVVIGHYHVNRLHTNSKGQSFLCMGDWINHFTYGRILDGQIENLNWPDESG